MSDAATRRLVLLRHGQTADNAAGIWQGHRDSVLSDLGREQAAGAAGALAAYRPRLVVSSDLQRARDTAEAVAAACGLPVRLDPQLREVDVGEWQGRSTAQVRESHPELVAAMGRGEDIRPGRRGRRSPSSPSGWARPSRTSPPSCSPTRWPSSSGTASPAAPAWPR